MMVQCPKNREIIIQKENACKISETEWLLVHRLNYAKNRSLSIDELCDPQLDEPLWSIGNVPQPQSLANLAAKINTKLFEKDIVATIKYSKADNEFSLTIPEQENPHNENKYGN